MLVGATIIIHIVGTPFTFFVDSSVNPPPLKELWAVQQIAARPGSLDQSIVASSEVPNDIPELITRYPKIKVIAFNGQKALKSFKKHILRPAGKDLFKAITFSSLPSTSPANAAIPYSQKQAAWCSVLQQAASCNNPT